MRRYPFFCAILCILFLVSITACSSDDEPDPEESQKTGKLIQEMYKLPQPKSNPKK